MVLLGEHLGELADHLIGHFVDRARRAGASWTLIGQSMGVTKQAAQKRFVPHEPTSPESGLQIFARYNDAARRAVVQGQQEAQRSGRDNIHPGHLLLGLVREPDTPVAAVLDAVGAALAVVAQNLWVLGIAVALMGTTGSVFLLARQSWLTARAPVRIRARAMSTMGWVQRVGLFLGPVIMAAVLTIWREWLDRDLPPPPPP